MEYVRLGTAGVRVSRLCLGTNMMGGYVDAAASAKLIDTFLECGGNFIDTADVYGQGKSEEAVGKALTSVRDSVITSPRSMFGCMPISSGSTLNVPSEISRSEMTMPGHWHLSTRLNSSGIVL